MIMVGRGKEGTIGSFTNNFAMLHPGSLLL